MAGIDRAGQGVERINVCFPKELADELRRYVPPRKRSELIIEGTIRMLAEIKRRDGLKAGAGAWSDEQHPELRSQEDVNRYLAGIRSSTNRRLGDEQLSS